MWIIPLEVHYCTVEQVSHFWGEKARGSMANSEDSGYLLKPLGVCRLRVKKGVLEQSKVTLLHIAITFIFIQT
jgi:hypothetical protein